MVAADIENIHLRLSLQLGSYFLNNKLATRVPPTAPGTTKPPLEKTTIVTVNVEDKNYHCFPTVTSSA